MSTAFILFIIAVAYIVWAGVVGAKWYSTWKLQKELYPKYIQDGSLMPEVNEKDFAHMFMRVEGPRLGLYLLAAGACLPFVIVLGIRVFNIGWNIVWKRTGELPWFEVGELPHSMILVFAYVAVLFGVAWITMRTYYKRAPGSFKTEMKRLNGET